MLFPVVAQKNYLDKDVQELRYDIFKLKRTWLKYGCTLMADGWSGPTEDSL